ncbi:hypothetical protein COOONC_23051 [Cooperia oncophora]
MYLQVATLVVILHYVDSSLPFCYRQHPRSNERICVSQFIWIMKSLVYANLLMISAQILIERRNIGPTPNGIAFAYFTAIGEFHIRIRMQFFCMNYYMKNDWALLEIASRVHVIQTHTNEATLISDGFPLYSAVRHISKTLLSFVCQNMEKVVKLWGV